MRFVYFILAEATGAIKIGSTGFVSKRIAALRTASPCRLVFLGASAAIDERECHRRFAPVRLGGEWFAPTSELLNYIAAVKDDSIECRDQPFSQSRLFGASVDDLVKSCGVGRATAYRWLRYFKEHGYVRNINGDDLVALTRVTGVSADVILGVSSTATVAA